MATILERFIGEVTYAFGGESFVRLVSEHGDELNGRYPEAKLQELGITRFFDCWTEENDAGEVVVGLSPRVVAISQEKMQEIEDRINAIFALDSFEGDY